MILRGECGGGSRRQLANHNVCQQKLKSGFKSIQCSASTDTSSSRAFRWSPDLEYEIKLETISFGPESISLVEHVISGPGLTLQVTYYHKLPWCFGTCCYLNGTFIKKKTPASI